MRSATRHALRVVLLGIGLGVLLYVGYLLSALLD